MEYERLLTLDKIELARIIKSKDEQIKSLSERIKNQDKLGKVFFKDKYYWVIFEEIE